MVHYPFDLQALVARNGGGGGGEVFFGQDRLSFVEQALLAKR